MIFKKYNDIFITLCICVTSFSYLGIDWDILSILVYFWLKTTIFKYVVYDDDDVMGSHASLWLWNRATWEKLNSPRKEEKDFPDPSWMEKEENKWDG